MKQRFIVGAGLIAGLMLPGGAHAQSPVELEHVSTFPESFGFLQSVRPLPDGRLLVADPLGGVLAALDPGAGSMERVGREGGGPGEWRQPDAVYALPGDSSLLVDLGNARLTVLTPAGRPVRSYPMALPTGGSGPGGLEILQPGATDAAGRVYFAARARAAGPGARAGAPDSSAVKRWQPGAETTERVVGLRPPAVTTATGGGARNQQVRMRSVPLAPQDDWAVAADGSVAVVRAEPYHVEWVGPYGRVTRGPALAFRPVPVGTAEKERYLDQLEAAGLSVNMTIQNGSPSMSFRRGGGAGGGGGRPTDAAERREYEWPETLPAFRSGGAIVAPDGRLWVERYGAAASPVLYDLFDRRGARVGQVRLPAGRQVIGFGDDAVYAVRVDELGLNWLEVYRPPR